MKLNHENSRSSGREPVFRAAQRPILLSQLKSALMLGLIGLLWGYVQTAKGQYSGGINIPEGYVQIEGDIIVTASNAAVLLGQQSGGVHPNFSYAPSRLWPTRVVPYDFDSAVTAGQRSVFLAAMNSWSNSFPGVTTISFKPHSGEAGYLHLKVGDPGGFSGGVTDYVGYNGGAVTITVSSDAVQQFLIAHEMGHALGLWHEQSRDDRDSYLNILTANIQSGFASQFDKKTPESTFGQYDYDSIMQYFACAFSKCTSYPGCACADASCITMQVVSPYSAQQCNIGQQNHLSAMDQRSMAFMYGPPEWHFLYSKSGSSGAGTFQQPYNSAAQAASSAPANSTLWVGPGSHPAAGVTFSTPMTLKAAIPDLQMQSNGSLGPSSSGYATFQ
jgi:hypothetical protein